MWEKFKASTIKESLLLLRDKAGLAMLFIMPVALVLLMTLLQDSTLRLLEEKRTPILLINHDADTFGIHITRGLERAGYFEVHTSLGGKPLSEELLKHEVLEGHFRVGIIIRKGTSTVLRNKIKKEIEKQFPEEEAPLFEIDTAGLNLPSMVEVYFDPVIKSDFRHAIVNALHGFSSTVEARMIFTIYTELLSDIVDIESTGSEGFSNLTVFDEQYATDQQSRIIPNSTQHNVPAWTVFAMFFIVIPLAGNIVKERESGLSLRLKTMPGSNLPVILGKASVYFIVGIVQAIFMLLIGVYILPLFGTPALTFGSGAIPLIFITLAVSLAASGYGILIGTMATSQEQSSIFGSISVVILAALGGIWVPTFMMSDLMVKASKISPLNWGLTAYYDILLRNTNLLTILPQLLMLLAFFVVCISIAFLYNRYKKSLT